MRKIIFAHGRAPGDCLMLSAGIRDFKALFPDVLLGVDTKFQQLFENNPNIDPSLRRGDPGVEFYRVGYPVIQGCNEGYTHFCEAFLLNMITIADAHESLGMSIGEFCSTFSGGRSADEEKDDESSCSSESVGSAESGISENDPHRKFRTWRARWRSLTKDHLRKWADIYLADAERAENPILSGYGVDRYWIVAPGGKRDCTCKIWDWRRFQDVVDHYEGALKFVVIGRSDHLIDNLRGTISWVDKTRDNVRDLFSLFYHASGVVTGVSFPMHLAGAMPHKPGTCAGRKPIVAIYGGREPVGFTAYEGSQVLHTGGALTCCPVGGCWQSRVSPLSKDAEKNNRLCHQPIMVDERPIQRCMDMITAQDVIRAIGRYYEGGRYAMPLKPMATQIEAPCGGVIPARVAREMNMLASLQSSGGGEQSAVKIAAILRGAGWTVNFHPWDAVHERFRGEALQPSLKSGAVLKPGLPLLFYANDQIWDFAKNCEAVVAGASDVIVGINYANGSLPKCSWLNASGKLRGVVFQNSEKRDEFRRDAIGFESTRLIVLHGAIDLERMYAVVQRRRESTDALVVLKHCKPDHRKYVTEESVNNGDKIHVWQRRFAKERDVDFYARLLRDLHFPIEFWFMQAHPELEKHFVNESRMRFLKWDEMPVDKFLGSGHVYLYRTSNLWRDQYPRCMGEAMAAGLPVIGEARDGPYDRIRYGDTGFYACDYDQYAYALKAFHRKEDLRYDMGYQAKEWARANLDPKRWIDVIEECLR